MIVFDENKFVKNPLVSVGVFTYNQEQYIEHCLDSILSQNTTFEYEIIIGEDCGTDKTRSICIDYQKRFPEKIKLLLHDENHGMLTNFSEVCKLMRGKYMADMDGDDYWVDELKLQKQVDYMEAHPEYGVCFTAGYVLTPDGELKDHPKAYVDVENGDVRAYSQYGPLGLSSSMFVRMELFDLMDWPEIIRRGLPAEDYVTNAVWGVHTQFAFLEDQTTVRRVLKTSLCHAFGDKKYRQGIINIRYYIAETFPNDYIFNIQELKDEWNYLEFRDAVLHRNYNQAKQYNDLISDAYKRGKLYCKMFQGPITFVILYLYMRIQKITYNPQE